MRGIKSVGVVAVAAALLGMGYTIDSPVFDRDNVNEETVAVAQALSGDPGGYGVYKNAGGDGQRVGAIGISGDGIDQDDLVSRGGSTLASTFDSRFFPPRAAASASAANVDAPEFGFDVSAQKATVTGEDGMTAGYIVQEHFPPGVPNAEGGPLFGIQFS
jgi:hypothetical protein